MPIEELMRLAYGSGAGAGSVGSGVDGDMLGSDDVGSEYDGSDDSDADSADVDNEHASSAAAAAAPPPLQRIAVSLKGGDDLTNSASNDDGNGDNNENRGSTKDISDVVVNGSEAVEGVGGEGERGEGGGEATARPRRKAALGAIATATMEGSVDKMEALPWAAGVDRGLRTGVGDASGEKEEDQEESGGAKAVVDDEEGEEFVFREELDDEATLEAEVREFLFTLLLHLCTEKKKVR